VRILHVVASYLPATRYGGTIVSVHGLCKALVARGHEVHVYTTSVDGRHDSDVPHKQPVDVDGVKVWYFRSPRARRLYYAPALQRALAREVAGFDIVHTHAVFLWPLWKAARAAHLADVPYVVSPRGMLEHELVERKSHLFKAIWIALIEKRSLEEASAVHVTSAREAEEAAAFGFNLPPTVEVPNGVDLVWDGQPVEQAPRIAAIVQGRQYVLFVGRVSWKKGLDRLVAALPFVSPELDVVIAGNDDEGLRPALESQAARLGVGSRLIFTGAADAREKLGLLVNARLLVLPSYSENFGNVVIEAMAAACPVIVTPEVGLAPVVERTATGWVVGPEPQVLGERISTLAADAGLRRAMGEQGRRTARDDFGWGAVAERMERAYEGIRRRRGTA
jgi:glycosyltransferase involved in cell wall biosynthesis